eukprot:g8191.t1
MASTKPPRTTWAFKTFLFILFPSCGVNDEGRRLHAEDASSTLSVVIKKLPHQVSLSDLSQSTTHVMLVQRGPSSYGLETIHDPYGPRY